MTTENRIINRVISDISIVLRETTLTVSDSIDTVLRSITENVRERSPTVRLISTVRDECLQPIANTF